MSLDQAAQIVGAALILVAFVAAQARRLSVESVPYLVANLVGSAILAVVAIAGRDIGFTMLEVVWAGVSAAGLVKVRRARGRASLSRPS